MARIILTSIIRSVSAKALSATRSINAPVLEYRAALRIFGIHRTGSLEQRKSFNQCQQCNTTKSTNYCNPRSESSRGYRIVFTHQLPVRSTISVNTFSRPFGLFLDRGAFVLGLYESSTNIAGTWLFLPLSGLTFALSPPSLVRADYRRGTSAGRATIAFRGSSTPPPQPISINVPFTSRPSHYAGHMTSCQWRFSLALAGGLRSLQNTSLKLKKKKRKRWQKLRRSDLAKFPDRLPLQV
ncbi:hypothetical protein L218DRAFT_189896 [Marasmius fiardii PR-910]|nr:hypothetical protein L218DRAFT_189896 [Marasmius fiardii PR-910]